MGIGRSAAALVTVTERGRSSAPRHGDLPIERRDAGHRASPPVRRRPRAGGAAAVSAALSAADRVTLAYAGLLTLVTVAFSSRIPAWRLVVSINLVASASIVALAWARRRIGGRALALLHDWYLPPLVFLAFKELRLVISPLHGGRDYDAWLIAADRWLFGTDPTRWLANVAHPLLTEILLVAYTSFWPLFLLAGFEAYRRKNDASYRRLLFTCVYGFYLSFAGYFFLPAVGPRFTLHEAAEFRTMPPGLWLTPSLKAFVDAGDSIPPGVPVEAARAPAQRDLFPSGHTMMSLVLIWWSAKLGLKVRYLVAPLGALIVASTMYLRYHYAVDLVGGAVLAVVCLATAPRLYAWMEPDGRR